MAKYWTFRDYVAQDGTNEIRSWLDDLPKRARTKINIAISRLEAMQRLEMPYVRLLKRECSGLMELRIPCENVQYRPLCCYGPGDKEVTLLFGATEKGGRFVPLSACEAASQRKAAITGKGRTCGHNFDEA